MSSGRHILDVVLTRADNLRKFLNGPYAVIRLRTPGKDPTGWDRTAAAEVSKGVAKWEQYFYFTLPPPPYELEVALFEGRNQNFLGQAVCNVAALKLGVPCKFELAMQVFTKDFRGRSKDKDTGIIVHVEAGIRLSSQSPLLSATLPLHATRTHAQSGSYPPPTGVVTPGLAPAIPGVYCQARSQPPLRHQQQPSLSSESSQANKHQPPPQTAKPAKSNPKPKASTGPAPPVRLCDVTNVPAAASTPWPNGTSGGVTSASSPWQQTSLAGDNLAKHAYGQGTSVLSSEYGYGTSSAAVQSGYSAHPSCVPSATAAQPVGYHVYC